MTNLSQTVKIPGWAKWPSCQNGVPHFRFHLISSKILYLFYIYTNWNSIKQKLNSERNVLNSNLQLFMKGYLLHWDVQLTQKVVQSR